MQESFSDAMAAEYPNIVVVSEEVAPGVLLLGVRKEDLRDFVENGKIAEVGFQGQELQEMQHLCTECAIHCSFSGACSWGLTSYRSATNAGDDFRVGIHESSAYSDSRISPYLTHLQLGSPERQEKSGWCIYIH